MPIPMQQMLLSLGAKKKSTYLEDVFSTYLYKGTGSAQSINNGVNISEEGGMVWIKTRGEAYDHNLFDTVRGVGRGLQTNANSGELTLDTNKISAFNNNGFTLGNEATVNANNKNVCSWTFRKAKNFFDVVSWTGNGNTSRQISHNLGCVPGCIMIKRTDGEYDWGVYHRGTDSSSPENYGMTLNSGAARSAGDFYFNDTKPTASSFTVSTGSAVNGNGMTYIAYVFAGGESTAATARSLILDGTGDYLSATSSDFAFGTGDFTIEGWFNKDDDSQGGFWDISTTSGGLGLGSAPACAWTGSGGAWQMYGGGDNTNSEPAVVPNTWFHVAQVRASGVTTMYVNGIPVITKTDTADYTGTHLAIGGYYATDYLHEGKVSNFRIVKGTAVYTSAFRPPTEPLTNITNTKILCCNDSSTTGKTVGPTITANGDPTASTDSPFDDPAAFTFGENGDQQAIKCGSYVGNGSTTGPEVYVGWEPQWILIKNASASEGWRLFDSMRGILTGGNDARLFPNDNDAESAAADYIDLTPTGFKLKDNGGAENGNGNTLTYVAIRRPDGYCGKPPKLGTDVFAMDTGNSSSTIPAFDSNFVVDMFLHQQPASAGLDWRLTTRFNAPDKLAPNTTAAESDESPNNEMDSNLGVGRNYTNVWQAWMWKRHAGFDVVTYSGNQTSGRQISHNLSKTPEMIWVKARSGVTGSWVVGHKGLNGGTDPWDYSLVLNTDAAEADNVNKWNDTAPNSTNFTLGNSSWVNHSSDCSYIAMLFASVEGVSKCGFYDGSSSDQAISLGFQPRFLIIKIVSGGATDWMVYDTTRGWPTWAGSKAASGLHKQMQLNTTGAQYNAEQVWPTSTGFHLLGGENSTNNASRKYIYYAHA